MSTEQPLCHLLGQTVRIYKNKLFTKFKENDIEITFEQFAILNLLYSSKDFTQQDLANQMQKNKSIILRQINSLLDKNYVERTRDDKDKRKKTLILTEKGISTLNQTRQLGNKVLDELFLGISENELLIFRHVLEKLMENSESHDSNCQC
jgi:DNA-binding MarR family transcriptional regulator